LRPSLAAGSARDRNPETDWQLKTSEFRLLSSTAVPSIGRLQFLEAPAKGSERARSEPAGTLVLLHAFPLHAGMWEAQLPLAEGGWRVIAPHFRGMGGFAGPAVDGRSTTMDDYAADVIDLLDALHVDEAVVGGLSMGGYVAFAMFRHAPRYFRGLILADTRPQADSADVLDGRRRLLATLDARGPAAVADEMIPRLVGATTQRERSDIVDQVRRLIVESSAQGIAAGIAALMSRADSTPLLGSIHCPTLVLVGEEDVITPVTMAEDMARAIAGAQLVKVQHAGHLTSLERPDTFNAAVGRFLEKRV
jgi:3-oxoadipate enol-lactonase